MNLSKAQLGAYILFILCLLLYAAIDGAKNDE